jgi:hypothetical protein
MYKKIKFILEKLFILDIIPIEILGIKMKKEKLLEINKIIKDRDIEVLDFIKINGKITTKSKCNAICKIHGLGDDFCNPWNPTINNLKNGSTCPKCSLNYMPTTDEAISDLSLILNTDIDFLGFIGGKYKGKKTKCIVKCKKHGLFGDLDKPSFPIYESLKNGSGCKICSITKNRNIIIEEKKIPSLFTEKQVIDDIKLKLKKNIRFYAFVDNEYKNISSKCIVVCNTHGTSDKWDNPTIRSYKNIIKYGFDCLKCNPHKIKGIKNNTGSSLRLGQDFAVRKIKEILKNKDIIFHNFENNFYKNVRTICIVECNKHGIGSSWETPWLPNYDNLIRGTKCPKCTGNYEMSSRELLECLDFKSRENRYIFNGFIGEYKSLNKTKCNVECIIHGVGVNFSNPWLPTAGNLKNGSGCPICKKLSREILTLRDYPELYKKERTLYYLKIKNKETNEIFYKIGIHSNSLKIRYAKSNLKKDNIQILNSMEVKLSNIIACIAEYSILNKFNKYKKNMRKTLKYSAGGTECFGNNIVNGDNLKELIKDVTNNIDEIFDYFEFDENKRDIIRKII